MGISEWTARDVISKPSSIESTQASSDQQNPQISATPEKHFHATWWFFGAKPQGDTEVLFQNIIRALGLSPNEWVWKNPADNLNGLGISRDGSPAVAFAFGGPAAQKLSGERDALPQLRETVLTLDSELEGEIPLIASFDLNYLLSKPKDKSLLWQDLLLAKSVLQNI